MRAMLVVLGMVMAMNMGLCPVAPAAAQGSSVSHKERKRAMKLFWKGKRLYRKEKFYRAVEKFKEAFRILPHKNILLNIAICYAEMSNPIEAVTHLRTALTMVGRRAEDILDPREYAKLLEMRSKVVIIIVESPDPEAEIFINRVSAGKAKVERVLMPGNHRVEIKVEGKTKAEEMFELSAGQQKHWKVPEWRTDAEKRRALAELLKKKKEKKVVVEKRKKISIAWFIATAAVAVAAGGAAVYTGVKTDKLADEYHRTGDRDTEKEGKKYKLATNVLLGVSVGAAAAAAVLAFFTEWRPGSRKERATSVTISPMTGPDGAGFVLSGRF